ncbi:Visual pigment-like receptor peropsin [Trichoplax sp. H2]|nr:Visual pigment-like receptor peropsin [Trichoplax sp. H2]|eukprot:RDD36980.1 Visual pigment-like receptor peropsin [Trichoplax sp. H2]
MNQSRSPNFSSTYLGNIAIIPISLAGIFANCVLLATIYNTKNFHTPSYILSANMAVSDILGQLFTAFYSMFNVLQLQMSLLTESDYTILCQWNYYGYNCSSLISALSFTVISIDRYITIMAEHNKKSSLQKPTFLIMVIIAIWIVSCTSAIPVIFLIKANLSYNYACDLILFRNTDTTLLIFRYFAVILTYPLPLITVTYLYYHVIRKIRLIAKSQATNLNRSSHTNRQIHATKMMIIATLIFMINNTIMTTNLLIFGSLKIHLTELLIKNPAIAVWITMSAIILNLSLIQNPIIYMLYNKTFRAAAISLFKHQQIIPD